MSSLKTLRGVSWVIKFLAVKWIIEATNLTTNISKYFKLAFICEVTSTTYWDLLRAKKILGFSLKFNIILIKNLHQSMKEDNNYIY